MTMLNSYITRTFSDIWEDFEEWQTDLTEATAEDGPFPMEITPEESKDIFYCLYSDYADSHIRYTNENLFKFKVFDIIKHYYPLYRANMDLINTATNTQLEDFIKAGKIITNQAQNPNSTPSTSSLEELTYINNQNTTNSVRATDTAIMAKQQLLKDNHTKEFFARFKKLFIQIMAPQTPLWYITETYEGGEE